jgi:hypothetical protein
MLPRVQCGLAGVGAESEAARRRAPDEPAQRPLAAALKTYRKFSPRTIMVNVRLHYMRYTATSLDE